MGPAPLRGGWGRGRVPTAGESHSPQGDEQGQGKTLGSSEDWRGKGLVFCTPT